MKNEENKCKDCLVGELCDVTNCDDCQNYFPQKDDFCINFREKLNEVMYTPTPKGLMFIALHRAGIDFEEDKFAGAWECFEKLMKEFGYAKEE